MQQTDEWKYLGMWMSPNGCVEVKNEKIDVVNQCLGELVSAARMRTSKCDVL